MKYVCVCECIQLQREDYPTFLKWICQGKYGVETFDKQELNVKDDTQISS